MTNTVGNRISLTPQQVMQSNAANAGVFNTAFDSGAPQTQNVQQQPQQQQINPNLVPPSTVNYANNNSPNNFPGFNAVPSNNQNLVTLTNEQLTNLLNGVGQPNSNPQAVYQNVPQQLPGNYSTQQYNSNQQPQFQTPSAPQVPQQLNGVTLDQLGIPSNAMFAQNQPQYNQTKQPQQVQQFNQQQQQLPDQQGYNKFAQDFQQYLGFPINELGNYASQYKQIATNLNELQSKQKYNESLNTLSQEWNLDLNQTKGRLKEIQDRWLMYPQDIRQKVDGVEGAKLIWAKIQQEKMQAGGVPQFQTNSVPGVPSVGGNTGYMFTASQLERMPQDEYIARQNEILQAYQNGLVLVDS